MAPVSVQYQASAGNRTRGNRSPNRLIIGFRKEKRYRGKGILSSPWAALFSPASVMAAVMKCGKMAVRRRRAANDVSRLPFRRTVKNCQKGGKSCPVSVILDVFREKSSFLNSALPKKSSYFLVLFLRLRRFADIFEGKRILVK